MRRTVKLVFLHACRLLGFFALATRIRSGKLLILCYHGFQLADECQFMPLLFISPERFRHRMALISKQKQKVLSLSEALERLYQGNLPPRALAITIDDGFYSTYKLAYPALRSHNYPATVYVTSYYVEKQAPIFRLVIQYMFWKSEAGKVELEGLDWTENRVLDLNDRPTSETVMWQLIKYGERQCSESERHELLSKVGTILDVDLNDILQSRILSLMSLTELKELSENGIDIQLHTHRHNFPVEDEFTARKEIQDNRAVLSKVNDKELVHFCYPSGIWNNSQWAWLESMEVQSATTCEGGYNDSQTHKFALRRFLDSERISDIEFLAEVSGFSDILRRARSALRPTTSGRP